jgi:hypothetical protein
MVTDQSIHTLPDTTLENYGQKAKIDAKYSLALDPGSGMPRLDANMEISEPWVEAP